MYSNKENECIDHNTHIISLSTLSDHSYQIKEKAINFDEEEDFYSPNEVIDQNKNANDPNAELNDLQIESTDLAFVHNQRSLRKSSPSESREILNKDNEGNLGNENDRMRVIKKKRERRKPWAVESLGIEKHSFGYFIVNRGRITFKDDREYDNDAYASDNLPQSLMSDIKHSKYADVSEGELKRLKSDLVDEREWKSSEKNSNTPIFEDNIDQAKESKIKKKSKSQKEKKKREANKKCILPQNGTNSGFQTEKKSRGDKGMSHGDVDSADKQIINSSSDREMPKMRHKEHKLKAKLIHKANIPHSFDDQVSQHSIIASSRSLRGRNKVRNRSISLLTPCCKGDSELNSRGYCLNEIVNQIAPGHYTLKKKLKTLKSADHKGNYNTSHEIQEQAKGIHSAKKTVKFSNAKLKTKLTSNRVKERKASSKLPISSNSLNPSPKAIISHKPFLNKTRNRIQQGQYHSNQKKKKQKNAAYPFKDQSNPNEEQIEANDYHSLKNQPKTLQSKSHFISQQRSKKLSNASTNLSKMHPTPESSVKNIFNAKPIEKGSPYRLCNSSKQTSITQPHLKASLSDKHMLHSKLNKVKHQAHQGNQPALKLTGM